MEIVILISEFGLYCMIIPFNLEFYCKFVPLNKFCVVSFFFFYVRICLEDIDLWGLGVSYDCAGTEQRRTFMVIQLLKLLVRMLLGC